MKASKIRASVLIAYALLVCGCGFEAGYYGKDRAAAESAAGDFRALYNSGKYADMYQLGDGQLQQSISLEQFITSVHSTFASYGAYKKSNQAAASCFPHQVRFVYLTEFEKRPATELMVWSVKHGKALLVNYQVSSGYVDVPDSAKEKCPAPN